MYIIKLTFNKEIFLSYFINFLKSSSMFVIFGPEYDSDIMYISWTWIVKTVCLSHPLKIGTGLKHL